MPATSRTRVYREDEPSFEAGKPSLLQLLDHVLLSLSLNSKSPRALILLKKAMLSPWGGVEVAGWPAAGMFMLIEFCSMYNNNFGNYCVKLRKSYLSYHVLVCLITGSGDPSRRVPPAFQRCEKCRQLFWIPPEIPGRTSLRGVPPRGRQCALSGDQPHGRTWQRPG